jgi:hypothetical protein
MKRPESDVPLDEGVANSRATGGDDSKAADEQDDAHSTTGTSENEEFVGRVSGQDSFDAEESGAEARAEAERSS